MGGKKVRIKGLEFYKEKGKPTYIAADMATAAYYFKHGLGAKVDVLAEVTDSATKTRLPPLGNTTADLGWLRKNTTPVSWAKLPQMWKDAFDLHWLQYDPRHPKFRG